MSEEIKMISAVAGGLATMLATFMAGRRASAKDLAQINESIKKLEIDFTKLEAVAQKRSQVKEAVEQSLQVLVATLKVLEEASDENTHDIQFIIRAHAELQAKVELLWAAKSAKCANEYKTTSGR